MEGFGHFAAGFSDMKTKTALDIGFNDSRGYFWRIGDPAKAYWQPDYETKVTDATAQQIVAFHTMFEPGGELLGIPVAASLGDFRGARLYKMSTYPQLFNISNLLVTYNGKIITSDLATTVNDPLTNEVFNIPIIMKPETLTMSSEFDGVDVIASKISGLIYGAGLKNQQRTSNRLGDESIMGTIDYCSGNIQLLRSNSKNDILMSQYEQFITEYQTLPPGTIIGGSSDGSIVNQAPIAPIGSLISINLGLTFQIFGNPVSVVWEFSLDGQS